MESSMKCTIYTGGSVKLIVYKNRFIHAVFESGQPISSH